MITKELLKKAFQNNVARIVKDPDYRDIACQIGEYWFWFGSTDSLEVLPEEYMKNHTMEEIINMIFDTLEYFREDGWDEYNYYEAVLNEMN